MKTEEKMFFSKNLIYLLEKNGMRKVDLAKNLNLSKSAVSNYLSGVSVPKRDILVQIAAYFQIPTEKLLNGPLDNPTVVLKENVKISYPISFFRKQLSDTEVIYKNDNYQSEFYSPIPVYNDMECYAVMAYDDCMSSFGIDKKSIVIYASSEPVSEGGIAAVLIKSEKKIVIRKVSYSDKFITLISDNNQEKFKKTSKGCDALVLGKVIHATFNPNK